jgi:hypothetical protein
MITGDYRHARQVIYDLHNHIAVSDIMTPLAVVEQPLANSQIAGKVNVSGWAMDDTAVSSVDVYVDGVLSGNAIYGEDRPDVGKDFPHAPAAIGSWASASKSRVFKGHAACLKPTQNVSSSFTMGPMGAAFSFHLNLHMASG